MTQEKRKGSDMDEDTKILWVAVRKMRNAQKRYFKTREQEHLRESKALERKVDCIVIDLDESLNLYIEFILKGNL